MCSIECLTVRASTRNQYVHEACVTQLITLHACSQLLTSMHLHLESELRSNAMLIPSCR